MNEKKNPAVEAILDDLKARARILHRDAEQSAPAALTRLRALPVLRALDDATLTRTVQRRHALAVIAREQGFTDWKHVIRVLTARGAVDDFGTALYPGRCHGHWNIWSAHYEEAARIRSDHGGYLLAYKHQFLIVDRHFIESLGLSPDDPDWSHIDRDWIHPTDPNARVRLYAKLLRPNPEAAAA